MKGSVRTFSERTEMKSETAVWFNCVRMSHSPRSCASAVPRLHREGLLCVSVWESCVNAGCRMIAKLWNAYTRYVYVFVGSKVTNGSENKERDWQKEMGWPWERGRGWSGEEERDYPARVDCLRIIDYAICHYGIIILQRDRGTERWKLNVLCNAGTYFCTIRLVESQTNTINQIKCSTFLSQIIYLPWGVARPT